MVDLIHETPIRATEVAARFGVHPKTVDGWFRRGLESAVLGRLVFTTHEAIQRFSRPREARCELAPVPLTRDETRLIEEGEKRHRL